MSDAAIRYQVQAEIEGQGELARRLPCNGASFSAFSHWAFYVTIAALTAVGVLQNRAASIAPSAQPASVVAQLSSP
jgi:hypothetical protein